MAEEKIKVRSITIDTVTGLLEEMYMTSKKNPNFDKWKDWAQTIWIFINQLQDLGFECITILGDPGTGKSVAMRNLPHNTNIWFNADNKNPTWTGGREEYGTKINPRGPYHVVPKSYDTILSHIKNGISKGMFEDNRYAILTGHIETYKSGDDTKERLQVIGNLANKMLIEKKFEMILYAKVVMESGKPTYVFETENNGFNTARSYMGLLDPKISNDYNLILQKLIEYNG